MHMSLHSLKLQRKNEVSGGLERLHSVKNGFQEGSQGTAGTAGHLEKGAEQ